jgi:putative oxidoreductase
MTSIALFVIRAVVGGLLAGHGAQKLFGWFGGGGPEGTAMMLTALKVRPPERWAIVGGASEFVGGILTALGLLNPLGPFLAIGAMATATLTAHKDKPIWGTKGGAELPVTNIAALLAVALAGPGMVSLDAIFGTRVPWWFSFLALAGVGGGVALAIRPAPLALPAPDRRAASQDVARPRVSPARAAQEEVETRA